MKEVLELMVKKGQSELGSAERALCQIKYHFIDFNIFLESTNTK